MINPRIRRDSAAARIRRAALRARSSGDLAQRQLAAVPAIWSDAVNDIPYYSDRHHADRWRCRDSQSLAIFHCVHNEREVYNVQMRLTDAGIDILPVTAPQTDRLALERRLRPRLVAVHPGLGHARFVYVDDVETSRARKRRWCVDLRSKQPSCVESPAS